MTEERNTPCPIIRFWTTCTGAGIHTLSFIAVLSRIQSGDSCRKVANSLGIACSTVWRAVRALDDLELIEAQAVPHPGGRKTRLVLCLSDKGTELIAKLNQLIPHDPATHTRSVS